MSNVKTLFLVNCLVLACMGAVLWEQCIRLKNCWCIFWKIHPRKSWLPFGHVVSVGVVHAKMLKDIGGFSWEGLQGYKKKANVSFLFTFFCLAPHRSSKWVFIPLLQLWNKACMIPPGLLAGLMFKLQLERVFWNPCWVCVLFCSKLVQIGLNLCG